MQLYDLPDDILVIVFKQCFSHGYDWADSFKCNLPLLAICQRLRKVVIPLVYDCAYVQYDGYKRHKAGAAVKINLDLIATVGCASVVRSIDIDVHCLADPLPGLGKVIEMMCQVAVEWKWATALKLALHTGNFQLNRSDLDMAGYKDDIQGTINALVALMPYLQRLDFSGTSGSPIVNSLYGLLAGSYAEQLRGLVSQQALIVPHDCQFKHLENFSINYDCAQEHCLPRMDSRALVELSISGGPSNHSWASFCADNDSNVVELSRLWSLSVAYHMAYMVDRLPVHHRDGHPWELQFPGLETIDICCTENVCPLVTYAVLPPCMESVTIAMPAAALMRLAKEALPVAKRLALKVVGNSGGGPRALSAINHIMESVQGSDKLELTICDHTLPVLPESFICTAMTRLMISGPTNLDTMFGLIQHLPNLVELALYLTYPYRGPYPDMTIPEAGSRTPAWPFRTKLMMVDIEFNNDWPSPTLTVALAKYLLLKIPTLTKLVAKQTPQQRILDFVEGYAGQYPHLGSIEFRLYEGDETDFERDH